MIVLRKGSRGDAVKKLQELLNSKGFNLTVDGIFGTLTENSIIAFQLQNGLKTDGIVGEKTWGKLLSEDGGDNSDSVEKQAESAVSKPSQNVTGSAEQIVTYNPNVFSLAKDGETYITPNFKVREFRSKCGSDTVIVDVDFVKNFLQKIREHFNKPISITSAYRSSEHNAKVGGGKNSFHLSGEAFDITVKDIPLLEVAKYAESIGIQGVIVYNDFIHLDSRKAKYFARNNNGKINTVTQWA